MKFIMQKVLLSIALGVSLLCNSISAQSTQEKTINITALNATMAQGYEFRGIAGNCIVLEKNNTSGVIKTNGQWLIKPSSTIRNAVAYNTIISEERTEEGEINKVIDGDGKELASIKYTTSMTSEEAHQMTYKYQLAFVNQLLKAEGTIQELPFMPRLRFNDAKINQALKNGYLIDNGKVLDRNGKLIIDNENVIYCGKSVFYLKDNNGQGSFLNATNENASVALNTLLEQGYSFVYNRDDELMNWIIMRKDGKYGVVNFEGQWIVNTELDIYPSPFYNAIEYGKNMEIFLNSGDTTKVVHFKYPENEKERMHVNNVKINFLLNGNGNIKYTPNSFFEYKKEFRDDISHVHNALQDGYLMFVEDGNMVLDKNGKVIISSQNNIIYCGNGLFYIENRGQKTGKFTKAE